MSQTEKQAERQIELHRVYRHFKGNYYLVEDVAVNADTQEKMVVYRPLYGEGGLWVRPLEEFLSLTETRKYPDAGQKYRFELADFPPAGQ